MLPRQLVCLAFSSLLVATVALAQTPVALELGKSVSAELAGGQTHQYMVTAKVGQFLRVNVIRPAISTTVRLLDPADQSKLIEVQWPSAAMEPNTLCWIARTTGEYRVEFAAASKTGAASKYEIKLEELRPAVAEDAKQIEAQNLIEEARALSDKERLEAGHSGVGASAVDGSRSEGSAPGISSTWQFGF